MKHDMALGFSICLIFSTNAALAGEADSHPGSGSQGGRVGVQSKLLSMTPKMDVREKSAPLKIGISQSFIKEGEPINKTGDAKQLSEQTTYELANQALARKDLDRARRLFEALCEQHPRDARYFYGAAMACELQDKNFDAYPDLVIAWHLDSDPKYGQAAEALTAELKKTLDDCFKLRFDWNREDPETVLNAGVRMWKAGLNAQAIKLFEYSLKNEPLYRSIAFYDLGAMAERGGNLKGALQYYQLAAIERARLDVLKEKDQLYGHALNRNVGLITDDYLRRAIGEVEQKLLRGTVKWNGFPQGYGTHWSTEVCPLCGISRTFTVYDGQTKLGD